MSQETGTARVKRGMAEMLKGGVIMDVVNAEQAKIAEDAGAVAVMALERVPADIRAQGGVARMSDPDMIEKIQATVSIPVMAKVRIGHFVEAQILESLNVDYIDESEVLTPADYINHVDKWKFKIPFVCGATNLGEALRRINEGAAMIRSKGEAGTGDVSNAVSHMRTIGGEIRRLTSMREDELYVAAKEMQAPYALLKEVAETGNLPVVLFTAGGIATPADADSAISVGGIDPKTRQHFSFSSYGIAENKKAKPNIVAPGSTTVAKPNNKYGIMFGTSFSSPLAAGFAACILEQNPSLKGKPMELKKLLEENSTLYPYFDLANGYGELMPKSLKQKSISDAASFDFSVTKDSIFIYPKLSKLNNEYLYWKLIDEKDEIIHYSVLKIDKTNSFSIAKTNAKKVEIFYGGYYRKETF
jgi:pyridoxal 5'-phosphate synthase pdxS subunit